MIYNFDSQLMDPDMIGEEPACTTASLSAYQNGMLKLAARSSTGGFRNAKYILYNDATLTPSTSALQSFDFGDIIAAKAFTDTKLMVVYENDNVRPFTLVSATSSIAWDSYLNPSFNTININFPEKCRKILLGYNHNTFTITEHEEEEVP